MLEKDKHESNCATEITLNSRCTCSPLKIDKNPHTSALQVTGERAPSHKQTCPPSHKLPPWPRLYNVSNDRPTAAPRNVAPSYFLVRMNEKPSIIPDSSIHVSTQEGTRCEFLFAPFCATVCVFPELPCKFINKSPFQSSAMPH